jgi:hypothetical protein
MDICFGTNAKPLSTHTHIYINIKHVYDYYHDDHIWSSTILIIILIYILIIIWIIVMYHLPKNMINTVTALIFITSPFHWQISPGFPDQTLRRGWITRISEIFPAPRKPNQNFYTSHSEIHDFLHATLGGKWLNMLAWFLGNFGSSQFCPGFSQISTPHLVCQVDPPNACSHPGDTPSLCWTAKMWAKQKLRLCELEHRPFIIGKSTSHFGHSFNSYVKLPEAKH